MNQQKLAFLQNDFLSLIEKIDPLQKPVWGKMNTQQMVEHMGKFLQVSTNRLHFPLTTTPEMLPKYRTFLLSEKEFFENTKAAVLGEEPESLLFETHSQSISFLRDELHTFFSFFETNPTALTQSPAFGDLNFEEWVQLHHKHAIHHLKQFGVVV